MWVIYQPLSLWMQLASLFFTCSGLNGDLLVIRFFLFLAYLMLFVNALLGSPMWPHVQRVGGISLDSVVWSVIGMYVHGSSLVCLVLDERAPRWTEDQEALWRLLYRTGGLSSKLFETMILPYLEVVEYDVGDVIPTADHFYIVYRGRVRLQVVSTDGTVREDRVKVAGEMFDFRHLDLLEPESIFHKFDLHCAALTPATKLFRFHKQHTACIANHRFAKTLWQALLINNLANLVEEHMQNKAGIDHGITEERLFGPLHDWEKPPPSAAGSGQSLRNPFQHLLQSLRKSVSPPWPFGGHPTGVRQTQLRPPHPRKPRHYGSTSVVPAGASVRSDAPGNDGDVDGDGNDANDDESPAAWYPARCVQHRSSAAHRGDRGTRPSLAGGIGLVATRHHKDGGSSRRTGSHRVAANHGAASSASTSSDSILYDATVHSIKAGIITDGADVVLNI